MTEVRSLFVSQEHLGPVSRDWGEDYLKVVGWGEPKRPPLGPVGR